VSHARPVNVLLEFTVGIQNCRLHVKPHDQFSTYMTLLYAIVGNIPEYHVLAVKFFGK
jgi:hypothetical protein